MNDNRVADQPVERCCREHRDERECIAAKWTEQVRQIRIRSLTANRPDLAQNRSAWASNPYSITQERDGYVVFIAPREDIRAAALKAHFASRLSFDGRKATA